MLKYSFGARLRVALGMQSQKDFAEEIGITPQTLNNYISGLSFPSEETLYKIAKLKKINIHWLITGDGDTYILEGLNTNAVESISTLIGMKNLTDQFIGKVAETVTEYNAKAKNFEKRKKSKK
jgi:transcriptional regulator with XRE-family HTH domain